MPLSFLSPGALSPDGLASPDVAVGALSPGLTGAVILLVGGCSLDSEPVYLDCDNPYCCFPDGGASPRPAPTLPPRSLFKLGMDLRTSETKFKTHCHLNCSRLLPIP